jgi:hypothetical protein
LIQLRAWQVARNVSRSRCVASWASKRSRKSGQSVHAQPGAWKSRLSAYFPAIQRRTAAAAWRSVSPAMSCMTLTRAKRQGDPATGRP